MKSSLYVVSLLALCMGCSSSATSATNNPAPATGDLTGDGEIKGERGTGGDGAYGEATSGASEAPSAGASADGTTGGASTGGTSSGNGFVQPGTLTAGVWDDNRNFDVFQGFRAKHAGDQGLATLADADFLSANQASFAATGPKQTLDIQIVIDTTGSMGDEIAYLNKEFDAMVSTIAAKYPGAQQHWSLVAYKDKHDEYVARWFDFRTDPTELHSKLATLTASGGGDFPESPEVALGVAHRLSWRQDAGTARLLFWIADAPHHDGDADAMATSLRGARDKGIHIYPVASSGIDERTELTMRSAAQVTGGRYVFLTDDSGVGGSHLAPSVPCFFVTKLNQAILRMVDIEMTGAYREPAADEIIRTGGDPQSGVCKIDTGTVTIY
jgi:hypothetical protein